MRILSVRENSRVAIGASWCAAPPTVTLGEVRALDAVQRRSGLEWFRLGHREIVAGQCVGSFAVGNRVYEILPKLDLPGDGGVRGNLHLMLAAGGLLEVEEAGLAPLLRAGTPLLPAYMALFVRRLATEWRRGPLRRYQVVEENAPFLRGRLLLRRQLRENLVRRERFACARDEFTADNPPARLMKAAVRACSQQDFAPQVAALARSLLLELDEVGDRLEPAADTFAPLERQYQRFAPSLRMASLILASESPSAEAGGARTFALMFEMFAVFEAFVAAELRAALGPEYRVQAQVGTRSLLERASEGKWKDAFRLKPDVAVWHGERLVCLIDTKWKRLDKAKRWNNVATADVYQMHAYATEYRSPKTILVYPRSDKFALNVDDYRRPREEGASNGAAILVRTVDVSRDLSDGAQRRCLRDDLRRIVEA